MDPFAQKFKKKFLKILKAENLTAPEMSEKTTMSYTVTLDYKLGRSGPSAQNLVKFIKAFPQYTCYLMDLDPKEFPKQIIFKD